MAGMAGFKFGMKFRAAKAGFMDRPVVTRAFDDWTHRFLSYQAGYIRKVARSRMPWARGRTAPAGKAPYRHTGLLHDLLFYAFDPGSQSVVVGPALVRAKNPYTNTTTPRLLEEGGLGRRTVIERRLTGRGRYGRRWRNVPTGQMQQVRYAPHPYMAPALEASQREDRQQKFSDEAWARVWAKSVH